MTAIATHPAEKSRLSNDADPVATLTGFVGPVRRPDFVEVDAAQPRPALHRTPLVPAAVLKAHSCYLSTDTRFRSAARLLQSLYRVEAGLAVGVHLAGDPERPTRIPLGSRLPEEAARAGHNFISPAVHALVRQVLVLREEGAAIDEDRLFGNLLSSMPVTFNLFGPMALDLALATAVWRRLLPAFVGEVLSIDFEHSPGRGDARFLCDGTAFDLHLAVITPDGEPASLFIEVKYSEGMSGPAARPRPRYDEASRQSRLYRDPDSTALRSVALEQLWREHMLAQLAVDHAVVNKAQFVVLGPRLNRRVAAAFHLYAQQLAEREPEDELQVGFTALTLEAVLEALAEAGATDLARQLWHRYLDFDRVLQHALEPLKPGKSPVAFRRARLRAAPTPARRPRSLVSKRPSQQVAPAPVAKVSEIAETIGADAERTQAFVSGRIRSTARRSRSGPSAAAGRQVARHPEPERMSD